MDHIGIELNCLKQDRLRFRVLELVHKRGAVVEMKLRVGGTLRDQRSKQISGSRVLFVFKIEAGENASEFGVRRSFVQRLKCGDGFLRLAFRSLELA